MSIIWDVIVSVTLSKKASVFMCPILNVSRDVVVLLYDCKIVDKEILRIVSNIGVYCSNDKVGAVYLVQYNTFSKIPPSVSMHFATRVGTLRVALLSAF